MFGIPGKAAVTLTPIAAKQIARLMAKQGSAGLRIGIKKGGCAHGIHRWITPPKATRWMRW